MTEEPQYPQVFVKGPNDDPTEYDESKDQWCEDHWERVMNAPGVPPLLAVTAMQDTLLSDGKFYEIAYRVKNGYGPPTEDEVPPGEWEVPEGERPGVAHINQAMAELSPLCCWLEDEREKWELLLDKARGDEEMQMEEAES